MRSLSSHHAVPQFPLPLHGAGCSHKRRGRGGGWGHEGMLTVSIVLQAAQRDAVGKGRCILRTLCWHGCMLTFAGGLNAGGESIMSGVLCARAEAVICSSLCLFGKRKGVCGLSLGKQSGDSAAEGRPPGWASPSSYATCLCVCQGSKGDAGTDHDWWPAIPGPHHFTSPLHPVHRLLNGRHSHEMHMHV